MTTITFNKIRRGQKVDLQYYSRTNGMRDLSGEEFSHFRVEGNAQEFDTLGDLLAHYGQRTLAKLRLEHPSLELYAEFKWGWAAYMTMRSTWAMCSDASSIRMSALEG